MSSSKRDSKYKPMRPTQPYMFDLLFGWRGSRGSSSSSSSSSSSKRSRAIDSSRLSIREMRHGDKYELFRIVNEYRRDFYINVYKVVFRSWFTYACTGLLLAASLATISSKSVGFFMPPVLVAIGLLWQISVYKRANRHLTVNEMEMMNLTTSGDKFKTSDARRAHQGVLLVFLKQSKLYDDLDLSEFDLLDSGSDSSSDDSDSSVEKQQQQQQQQQQQKKKKEDKLPRAKLIGYMVYGKQSDELETVCIKELCIDKDYRQRRVASQFIRRVCINVFRSYGYRRVCFQVSNLNEDTRFVLKNKSAACKSSLELLKRVYSWIAFDFVPGVCDERTVYTIDLAKLDNEHATKSTKPSSSKSTKNNNNNNK